MNQLIKLQEVAFIIAFVNNIVHCWVIRVILNKWRCWSRSKTGVVKGFLKYSDRLRLEWHQKSFIDTPYRSLFLEDMLIRRSGRWLHFLHDIQGPLSSISRLPDLVDSQIPRLPVFQIPSSPEVQTFSFPDCRVSSFLDFQVSRFPDFDSDQISSDTSRMVDSLTIPSYQMVSRSPNAYDEVDPQETRQMWFDLVTNLRNTIWF